MIKIQNESLRVEIDPKGAELTSLVNSSNQLEYMWSGDPAFWAKRSPVLFPIVGTLKENTYQISGETYVLGRHGFARDRHFIPEKVSEKKAVFLLKSDQDSLHVYPFNFEFRILYELRKATLNVTYEITNTGNNEMLFSVGGHPAFALPLVEGTQYEDYYLEFEQKETIGRWPISEQGLIEKKPVPLLDNSNTLALTKELFHKDAIVLKGLASTSVSLRSDKTPHGFIFDFADFPFLGLWAAKDADFICIEPWCGIADSVDTNQQLEDKEGIEKVEPGGVFSRTWSVEVF
jgi:galactose mutarotase-like enzyme